MAKADILPMGSLVYLRGGDMKLMVIARGPVFEDDKGETVYADYEDEEEERYREVYSEWEADLEIEKAKTPE